MIRYALRCGQGHRFDSWFGSSDDFDRLEAAGLLACAVCSGGGVSKVPMAPAVGGTASATPLEAGAGKEPSGRGDDRAADLLRAPPSPAMRALAEFRRHIEARSENVGRDFAGEARRIHAGEAPRRPIRGEARLAEARALVEDGIPVVPLPWPARKPD